jgi:hypothetical protein
LPGHVLSMGKLGWQPRSAVMERREADAEGMGARAVFEPCKAGFMLTSPRGDAETELTSLDAIDVYPKMIQQSVGACTTNFCLRVLENS